MHLNIMSQTSIENDLEFGRLGPFSGRAFRDKQLNIRWSQKTIKVVLQLK